jgi:hypothetical protein
MDIQAELEKELKRLQDKYGTCTEYTVEWQPCEKHERLPFSKDAVLKGEVDKIGHRLLIYDSDWTEARHTLLHEFFEACFDVLASPYIEMYNHIQRGYEHAFMQITYSQKESLIEKFVKQEEKVSK